MVGLFHGKSQSNMDDVPRVPLFQKRKHLHVVKPTMPCLPPMTAFG